MRNIIKRDEPASLTEHRCNINSDYDNYSEKSDLREGLVKEQRGICCYCMQRIRPNLESMKIEHWQCQTRFLENQLDYNNLLGACLGSQGKEPKKQHCDTRKGNHDLSYNPASPLHDVESKLDFLADGIIKSNEKNFDRQINKVLNLNTGILVKNRKAILDSLQTEFMTKNPTKANVQRELRKWNGDNNDGNLEPFCQVVIYYLRKKLRRMA